MTRGVAIGLLLAAILPLGGYLLTFATDPGSAGRALGTGLGFCIVAIPGGALAGWRAAKVREAAKAALVAVGAQAVGIAAVYLFAWKGSWDLAFLFAVGWTLQSIAVVGAGWLSSTATR